MAVPASRDTGVPIGKNGEQSGGPSCVPTAPPARTVTCLTALTVDGASDASTVLEWRCFFYFFFRIAEESFHICQHGILLSI